jgi:hypothetical protein
MPIIGTKIIRKIITGRRRMPLRLLLHNYKEI